MWTAIASASWGTTVCVWTNSPSEAVPYDGWANAARSLKTAVDFANTNAGVDSVLATNGTYFILTPIVVTTGITVRSVNGPLVTTVSRAAGSRVFDLQYPGAALVGLTIRDGSVTDVSHNNSGGGVYSAFSSCMISNCILTANLANHYGGGAWGGTAENCTIVSNYAWRSDGWGSGGGVHNTVVTNSIVMFNLGWTNTVDNWSGGSQLYTCTTPLPGGAGNIAADPLFMSVGARDFRLNGGPCVDAGTNLAWMGGASDLDGNARIKRSRVDMGAYEWQPPKGAIMLLR